MLLRLFPALASLGLEAVVVVLTIARLQMVVPLGPVAVVQAENKPAVVLAP